MLETHQKIIHEAAKKQLIPSGLFRIGSSRRYIDDNDYFVIQVEFQPSAYDKGSCLNVGISFLWETSPALDVVLAFEVGGRVAEMGYAGYSGDDAAFSAGMERFSEAALQKVQEYRLYRDMDYAKQQLEQRLQSQKPESIFWEPYQLAMLCFLKRDFADGKRYFDQFLKIPPRTEWQQAVHDHCCTDMIPKLTTEESTHQMVCDMIIRRRAFFAAKPAYRKLKKL